MLKQFGALRRMNQLGEQVFARFADLWNPVVGADQRDCRCKSSRAVRECHEGLFANEAVSIAGSRKQEGVDIDVTSIDCTQVHHAFFGTTEIQVPRAVSKGLIETDKVTGFDAA